MTFSMMSLSLSLVFLLATLSSSTGEVENYSYKSCVNGCSMDDTHKISESQKSQLMTCAALCSINVICSGFIYNEEYVCQLYEKLVIAQTGTGGNVHFWIRSASVVFLKKLVVKQDSRSGEYFPQYSDTYGWEVNAEDPNSNIYMDMSDIEQYFNVDDGGYHFKLCYPSVFAHGDCYEFKQMSDPRTGDSIVTGFELLRTPSDTVHIGIEGLVSDSRGSAWLDGRIGSTWHFAVACSIKHQGGIPGPYVPGDSVITDFVQLFILSRMK